MKQIIVGIDPGKSGGIAWIDEEGIPHCEPMPETEGDIVEFFERLQFKGYGMNVMMEKLSGFCGGPGNPGSTMFTMAMYYWCWIFLCLAYRVPVTLVTPQSWQKQLSLGKREKYENKGKEKTVWKNKLKAEAQRRYPGLKITLSTADAVLIMECNRIKNK